MPPRKGQPGYAISQDWQNRVRERLVEMDISQSELARRAHISKSAVSEALMAGAVETTVMPEIHKALGWPVPQIVLHPDRLELLALYESLSEFDQGAHLERLRQQAEQRKRRK